VLKIRFEIVILVIVLFQIRRIVHLIFSRPRDLTPATGASSMFSVLIILSGTGMFLVLAMVTMIAVTAMTSVTPFPSRLRRLPQGMPVALVHIRNLPATGLLRFQLVDVLVQKTQAGNYAQFYKNGIEIMKDAHFPCLEYVRRTSSQVNQATHHSIKLLAVILIKL
jgi:hypothetical protein